MASLLGTALLGIGSGAPIGLINKVITGVIEYKKFKKGLEVSADQLERAEARNMIGGQAWMRRYLCFVAVTSFVLCPYVCAYMGWTPVIGVNESNGWLKSIFFGNADMRFEYLHPGTFFVLYAYEYISCVIIGFYCGKCT